MLAATLAAVGTVPVEGLALLIGIDRVMSECRAITNLIGNGVATVVVAKWEGALDEARARQALTAETDLEADEPEKVLDARMVPETLVLAPAVPPQPAGPGPAAVPPREEALPRELRR